MIYSSTSERYFSEHCPRALQFYLDGEPMDTRVFDVGIAAHAVLEECGRRRAADADRQARIADEVVHILMTEGHSYFGQRKPPMAPEAAIEGREIALAYLAGNELPDGKYEAAFYIDALGNAGGPETGRFRALIDLVFEDEYGDEEFSGKCLFVRDYKTSWAAGEDQLTTLQRKAQAVTVWVNMATNEHIGIVRQVVNVRTGAVFEDVTWLDEVGIDTLGQWRHEILMVCDAMDKARDPRPGIGCMTCPYVLSCEACYPRAKCGETIQDRAIQWMQAEAVRAELAKELREMTKEAAPVEVDGGSVGYHAKAKRRLLPDAPVRILEQMWGRIGRSCETPEEFEAKYAAEIGLLRSADISVTAAEKLAKTLYPGRDMAADRRAFMDSLTEEYQQAEFGGQKK